MPRILRLITFACLPIFALWLLLSSMWVPAAFGVSPTVLYVDKDAGGATHDGASWATAYTTLQDALDTTNADGHSDFEIWVAEGVYYPDLGGSHVANSRSEWFRINYDNVQLYGGFAATETLRTQRDPAVHLTILSGDIDGNDTNTDGNFIAEASADIQGSNAYHVLYLDGQTNEPLTTATVLDGFVVTAGSAGGAEASGGGLYCAGRSTGGCSPTVATITFSGNMAGFGGGGMFNDANVGGASSPTLTNVTFTDNTAYRGGGMYNNGQIGTSSPILTNVTFSGNKAENSEDNEFASGGGMFNFGAFGGTSSPMLTNVTFTGNTATVSGGGMDNYSMGIGSSSSPTITNVTFAGNTAGGGGGMYNYSFGSATSPLLTNVTFSGNMATGGGGMYNSANTSNPRLVNVIMWGDSAPTGAEIYNVGGTPVISYSIVDQDGITGTGNIRQDPLLSTLADHGGGMLTFALFPGSPAIDTGDNAACAAAPVNNLDQRGVTRPQGSGCDIGAYESRGFTLTLAGGTPQTTTISSPFAVPLAMIAGSGHGEPLGPGGVLVFTPPAGGPGLTVTAPFTVATDVEGVGASIVVTANEVAGSFNVTATAAGVATPMIFNLTNTSTPTGSDPSLEPQFLPQLFLPQVRP